MLDCDPGLAHIGGPGVNRTPDQSLKTPPGSPPLSLSRSYPYRSARLMRHNDRFRDRECPKPRVQIRIWLRAIFYMLDEGGGLLLVQKASIGFRKSDLTNFVLERYLERSALPNIRLYHPTLRPDDIKFDIMRVPPPRTVYVEARPVAHV